MTQRMTCPARAGLAYKIGVHPRPRPPLPRVRVLVVDDEPILRTAMAELLRDEGFVVDEAGNGAVALEKAIACRPDVVVFDYAMPVFDGPALVESLRLIIRPHPIFVGVSAIKESRAWCNDHGIPIFVMKPFEDATLLRAVDSALELARERDAPRKKVGSGTRLAVRSAAVLAVGQLHGDEPLHALLPDALRHARVIVVDHPSEAERILDMIVPDLLVLDDAPEHDRLRAVATAKAVPVLVRPAAISDARILAAEPSADAVAPVGIPGDTDPFMDEVGEARRRS